MKNDIVNEEEKQTEEDPALRYYRRCKEKNSLLLPIFDKIFKKCLTLQDYMLNEGHCLGIAEACEFIDHQKMNRVLLSNCGLSGDNFATILEGLAKIRDFKSIIYKLNEMNSRAVQCLRPLFEKNIPNQLNELEIIDCRIDSSVLEELLSTMIEGC